MSISRFPDRSIITAQGRPAHQLRVLIEVSVTHGEVHGVLPDDRVLSRVVSRRGVGTGVLGEVTAATAYTAHREGNSRGIKKQKACHQGSRSRKDS